jgi:hypothetical protein
MVEVRVAVVVGVVVLADLAAAVTALPAVPLKDHVGVNRHEVCVLLGDSPTMIVDFLACFTLRQLAVSASLEDPPACLGLLPAAPANP